MGLFKKMFGGKGEAKALPDIETKGGEKILTSADLALLLQGGNVSTAGVGVNPSTALRYVTVWACVRLLAESIAQLPIHIYQRKPDGSKQRVFGSSLADLLTVAPNSWQTSFEYIEFLVTGLCLRGNHYAFINRVGSGANARVAELIPLLTHAVSMQRTGYDITYTARLEDGTTETFPAEKIHHVRGLSLDGFIGVSPIAYQRNAIGLGIAAENHGSYVFKNGAKPSGILSHPGKLLDEAYKRIKKSWNQTHGGENQGGTAVLEEGLKFEKISMSNEDAQYLETRAFQRTEICSIYRVPPHMIGDLTKSSFSNITQQSLEFVKYTILPWVRRIEAAISRDLFTAADRQRGLFVEFLVSGLERADLEQRYRSYNIGIMSGVLSPNECRSMENRNPRPGGDLYLAPLNMADSTNGLPSADNGDDPENQDTSKGTHPLQIKSIATATAAHPPPGGPLLTKGVLAREQLRAAYAPRFQALAGALVAHETGSLRDIITDDGGQVGPLFANQSAEFYRQLPGYIRNQFLGLMREYAVAVRNASLAEIESDHELPAEALAKFVEELVTGFSTRHVYSSENQLAALINETVAEELPAAIEQRFAEWDATRAEKIASREPVQQESAVARMVWGSAGITKLQWQRRGSKSCPFCKALNGKVVGIAAPFLDQGDFTPEGHDQSPLKVRGPKMHAPIHGGCVCIITPVRG